MALIPKAANTVKERSRSKEALTSDRKEEGFEFLTLSADGGNDEKEEVSNGASLKSESSKGQSQGISQSSHGTAKRSKNPFSFDKINNLQSVLQTRKASKNSASR